LIARKITFLSDSFEFNGEPATNEKHPPPRDLKLFPTRVLTISRTRRMTLAIVRNILFGAMFCSESLISRYVGGGCLGERRGERGVPLYGGRGAEERERAVGNH